MASVQVRYIVNDVDASIKFYCEQLGFHEDMRRAPSFAMLTRGELRLVLSKPGDTDAVHDRWCGPLGIRAPLRADWAGLRRSAQKSRRVPSDRPPDGGVGNRKRRDSQPRSNALVRVSTYACGGRSALGKRIRARWARTYRRESQCRRVCCSVNGILFWRGS